LKEKGPVHPVYNPSFSACFFSQNSIFSHNKSATGVFQPAYQHSQTGPKRRGSAAEAETR
jgi:hypothetical protein